MQIHYITGVKNVKYVVSYTLYVLHWSRAQALNEAFGSNFADVAIDATMAASISVEQITGYDPGAVFKGD